MKVLGEDMEGGGEGEGWEGRGGDRGDGGGGVVEKDKGNESPVDGNASLTSLRFPFEQFQHRAKEVFELTNAVIHLLRSARVAIYMSMD